MTLINHDLVSPFLSPRGRRPAGEERPMPFDDSPESMRRLRDPFAVDPATPPRATTGDEPTGS
jgi:hypothetical protein